MAKVLRPPPPAPDKARLLEVFRRTVPREYYVPIAEGEPGGLPHPSFALFRGISRVFEAAAQKGTRSAQARFYLPSAVQRDAPATSGRPAGIASGLVTLNRVGPTTQALIIEPGRIRLVFDGGDELEAQGAREYINLATIQWNPNEGGPKTVRFVSDVSGFIGNLDFLADENGLLPLDLIAIKDQNQNRANVGGSILFGSQSILQDNGSPDVFSPSDVGLYVRIDDASTAANVGALRRITGFDWPEVESPQGSGRYPYRVFLEDVLRRNALEVLQDDGGVITDLTIPARNETPDDVPLFPDPFVVNDAAYFGFTKPLSGLRVDITPGDGDWDVAWEYWDGLAWVALPDIDDVTNGFKPAGGAGTYQISWTVPPDWASVLSPNGTFTAFYVRARVSAFVSATAAPVAGRVVLLVPEPLDGILDATEALQDDGGVFTDFTAEAGSNVPDDVPLTPAAPVVNDAFYFGLDTARFSSVQLRITTPGEGDWVVTWEYFDDGGLWQPLPGLNDASDAFRIGGVRTVSWTPPDDWDTFVSPVTANPRFFVRARISSFTSIVTQPLAAQVKLGALLDDGTVKWTLYDFENNQAGLGLELVEVEAFSGGRDDDLFVLGDERGIYRQQGETDEVFRDRVSRLADVVSPNAILSQLNRILRPLGFKGSVCDVQFSGVGGGFFGLFMDVDPDLAPDFLSALDLYGPGDLFPTEPFFVLQSAQEAYGWFLVKVPYLGQGDFGIFLDDGPLYFDESVQVFYGPSAFGFMDGAPTQGNATYAAIHSAIAAIKAGGVGFTLIRSENLTTP